MIHRAASLASLVQDLPDLDVMLVPLGGGALAAGCGVAATSLVPDIEVIGVQSEACEVTFRSWRSGTVVRSPCATIADGLAVDEPDQVIVALLCQRLQDVVVVSEEGLLEAMRVLATDAHNLVEPSGVASVAAIRQERGRWEGKRVGVVITGGNAREEDLMAAAAPPGSYSTCSTTPATSAPCRLPGHDLAPRSARCDPAPAVRRFSQRLASVLSPTRHTSRWVAGVTGARLLPAGSSCREPSC